MLSVSSYTCLPSIYLGNFWGSSWTSAFLPIQYFPNYQASFTQGKQDAFCHQEVIRAGGTEKECSGTRRLDNKTALAIDADHTPWGPGAEVPYSLESPRLLETDKQLFREAIAYIESLSCIR